MCSLTSRSDIWVLCYEVELSQTLLACDLETIHHCQKDCYGLTTSLSPIDYVVRIHMYQADDPMKRNKPYQQ